jgi:hypothetical protein
MLRQQRLGRGKHGVLELTIKALLEDVDAPVALRDDTGVRRPLPTVQSGVARLVPPRS